MRRTHSIHNYFKSQLTYRLISAPTHPNPDPRFELQHEAAAAAGEDDDVIYQPHEISVIDLCDNDPLPAGGAVVAADGVGRYSPPPTLATIAGRTFAEERRRLHERLFLSQRQPLVTIDLCADTPKPPARPPAPVAASPKTSDVSSVLKAAAERLRQHRDTLDAKAAKAAAEAAKAAAEAAKAAAEAAAAKSAKAAKAAKAAAAAAAKAPCAICRNVLFAACATATACGHVFCTGCIRSAVVYDARCPICKRPLRPEQLVKLYL